MKKRIKLTAISFLMIFLTGCTTFGVTIKTNSAVESKQKAPIDYFVGTWYCSAEDSINNMEITLTFTKTDDKNGNLLNYTRDMIDPSEGYIASDVSGVARASLDPDNLTMKIDYLKGDGYIEVSEDMLIENFDDCLANYFKKVS